MARGTTNYYMEQNLNESNKTTLLMIVFLEGIVVTMISVSNIICAWMTNSKNKNS